MRPEFEHQLKEYSDIAKQAIEVRESALDGTGDARNELLDLSHRLNESIDHAIQIRRSNTEAQTKIFSLQIQKQQIMDKLHSDLRLLDEPIPGGEVASSRPAVEYVNGNLMVQERSGMKELTVGELLTDMEWDKFYDVHNQHIPRQIRKKYLIESAKFELNGLMNEQILRDELSDRWVATGKEYAYQALLDERRSIPRFGHIAEIMVKNYIAKLGYDHGFDVEIELGNVYQDVEYKIDFLIKFHKHTRGVGVEETDHKERVAVQFTINTDQEVMDTKQSQVATSKRKLLRKGEVDDMALVQLGADASHEMRDCYNQWIMMGKPSGGPDKLLSLQTKRDIFMALFANIYSPEELEQGWNRIAQSSEAVPA